MARCIQLDMDCVEVCRLAAAYMARGSDFTADVCEACALVCDACAQECAKACRRCAEECRRMPRARRPSGRDKGRAPLRIEACP